MILNRQRRSRVETYLLMGFGLAVIIWAWFGDRPRGEEFWMFLSGMLALAFGESLFTSRTAKIEEAEDLFEQIELAQESEPDRALRETDELMEQMEIDR